MLVYFNYINGQPKGTFTNDELQLFVNVGWLTQAQYNQLAVTDTTTTSAATQAATSATTSAQSNASNATN